jgi:5'-methylthioinosine phosphorylase
MAERAAQFAIIGGSGFHSLGAEEPRRRLLTRYGPPSAPVRPLDFGTGRVHFLARHGEDHSIPPHRINYRANLQALRMLEVDHIVALNTVGVLDPARFPARLAVPDQLIDGTYGRVHSICDGISASLEHIDFTEPFCPWLRKGLIAAARAAGVPCHDHGVYAATQGPRLETAAEIDRLARDGADLVGLSLLVNAAAGRGGNAIHEDIEANMEAAKADALRVLRAFFQGDLAQAGA